MQDCYSSDLTLIVTPSLIRHIGRTNFGLAVVIQCTGGMHELDTCWSELPNPTVVFGLCKRFVGPNLSCYSLQRGERRKIEKIVHYSSHPVILSYSSYHVVLFKPKQNKIVEFNVN